MDAGAAPSPLVELVQFLVAGVVSKPDSIEISRVETPRTDLFYLTVAPDDLGRLLGREGRTVESIRALVEVAAARYGKAAVVDVVEPERPQRERKPRGGGGRRSRKRRPRKRN